jgi:superfamily II DNA or RNA helicase
MSDIEIVLENNINLIVVPNQEHILLELDEYFSFEKERNAYQRKKSNWNGIVHLYNKKTGRLPVGLLHYVLKFANEMGYSINVDPMLLNNPNINREDFVSFITDHIKPCDATGSRITPHDYQYMATYHALKERRCTLLAATSAGKSLVIYLLSRILSLSDEKGVDKKILITVPTISLVEQLYNDFHEYSNKGMDGWKVDSHVQKVSSQYEKLINKVIVISTWQSAIKFYDMEQFGVWINDEVHNAKANSFKDLSNRLVNAKYRVGLTGTLDDIELHHLEIQGIFGKVKRIIKAKELQNQGKAAQTQIYSIILDHPSSSKRYLDTIKRENKKKTDYEIEMQFLMDNPLRNLYLTNLAKKLSGNTLILTNRVDSHLLPLYESMKDKIGKPVFAIHGKVDAVEREEIRNILETYDDAVIIATMGTMSTGVSIKKLHNLVFAYSSKAKIKILQSIGRLMRMHDSKDVAKIIDISDDLSLNPEHHNISMNHLNERIKFYYKEGWDVKFSRICLTTKG